MKQVTTSFCLYTGENIVLDITNPELLAAIKSYDITAVSFISLNFPTTSGSTPGWWHITEAPRDITIGGITYNSSNELQGISAPATQNSVDRDNYSLSFADNNAAIRNRFTTASGGALNSIPIIVKLGFLKEDGTLISELLNVYSGQSSSVQWKSQNNGFSCVVAFTGQLTQLDSSTPLMTSQSAQQTLAARVLDVKPWISTKAYADGARVFWADTVWYAEGIPPVGQEPSWVLFATNAWKFYYDTSMDQVHEGVNDATLKWGKSAY